MKWEIKVPSVGESVSSADIESWEKPAGSLVRKGEVVAILETDKASMDIPAEEDGILGIIKAQGETVQTGEAIGWIESTPSKSLIQETSSPDKIEKTKDESPAQEKSSSGKKEGQSRSKADSGALKESPSLLSTVGSGDQKNIAPKSEAKQSPSSFPSFKDQDFSPSVRRLVETGPLDPSTVEGTGRGGRLTKEDILKALQQSPSDSKTPPAGNNKPVEKEDRPVSASLFSSSLAKQADQKSPPLKTGQRRVAMTSLRRKTAQKLVLSQQNTATLSTFNEVDMSRIMEIRKAYQEEFVKKQGCKLGFMSFFVQAVVAGLKEFPRINAFMEGSDIIYNDHQHIGIAVGTEKGLVVPVLFYAERLSLAEIEKKILEYKNKALSRKLMPDDLLGGTFTISNGGVFGSLLSTPVLNPPQSGILGMHKIESRPVALKGKVEIRPMMYVTLSYDHRIVDGRESVGFLVKVKEYLEEPSRLLLGI